MSKTKGFLLTAGLVLATAFTISCSESPENNNTTITITCGGKEYDPYYEYCEIKSGSSSVPSSSSSVPSSSSSVPNSSISYGSVSYDGKTYKTVKIGEQVWFAENLNYNVVGSKCYYDYTGSDDPGCLKYGRLYDWLTAMDVCPSGWHLPSDAEWTTLINYVGSNAGKKLKSSWGWNGGEGTDDYGFSALPGGFGTPAGSGNLYSVGFLGNWWSATEDNSNLVWFRYMLYEYTTVLRGRDNKNYAFLSVRCLQDSP